jgi:hypothetical protein
VRFDLSDLSSGTTSLIALNIAACGSTPSSVAFAARYLLRSVRAAPAIASARMISSFHCARALKSFCAFAMSASFWRASIAGLSGDGYCCT